VEHFIETANLVGDQNLLLALDHEDPRVPLAAVKEFLTLVKARVGRFPILYSGFLIKQQLATAGGQDPFLAQIRFWLAQYSSAPSWPSTWVSPWLWQYTGDGNGLGPHEIDGIDGTGIDINSYQGSPAELAAEWAA
jgi:GH25 family lysozyme M1 (1,4-beta-N-acetylmuramidase)